MELFKLFGSILIDDKEANKSLSRVEKKTESFTKGLGKALKGAGKLAAGIGMGAGALGAAVFALGLKTGEAADRILDLNSATGMSTDEIQKWEKAAKLAGTNTETMTNASAKLTKSLDAMSVETDKGAEALGKLGLTFDEIEKMSADERMNVLTEALGEVDDKTERARIGTDLFGKSWADMAPIIDLGKEALENAKGSANIISNDDLNMANDFRMKVVEMKDQLGHFVDKIGLAVMPMLISFMESVEKYLPVIEQTFKEVFDAIALAVDWGIEKIQSVMDMMGEWFSDSDITLQDIKDAFVKYLDLIKERVEFIFNTIHEIVKKVLELVVPFIKEQLDKIMAFWNENGEQIMEAVDNVFTAVKKTIEYLMPIISEIIEKAWKLISGIIESSLDVIMGIIEFFVGVLTGDWQKAWDGIKSIVKGVWDGITGIVQFAVDQIADIVNGIMDKVNAVKNAVSNFLGSKPVKSGIELKGNFKTGLPGLAHGGTVTEAGHVMVGEVGPEILDLPKGARVTPLDKVGGGVTLQINNPKFFNQQDVDKMMEPVIHRLRTLRVT
jgi:hypothetical protein